MEGVAIDYDPANGREWQMGGYQQFAGLGRPLQQADTHTNRFLGIVLEAVVPVGVVKADEEYGVAGEGQPISTHLFLAAGHKLVTMRRSPRPAANALREKAHVRLCERVMAGQPGLCQVLHDAVA